MAASASRDSLRRRMRSAQMVLVVLMLIPAVMAIAMMMVQARAYHNVIAHVAEISEIRPLVQEELLTEIMDVVTGRKWFSEGRQYAIIARTEDKLDSLIAIDTASRVELEVSRRLLDTLTGYVDKLGETSAVDTQMAVNDEIKDVAQLFSDMLQTAVNAEINAAAVQSAQMQATIRVALVVEILVLAASLGFAALTQSSLSRAVRVPLDRLQALAGRIAGGELSVRAQDPEVEELRTLTHSLNTMAFKLEGLMEENRREQENLKKSELRVLQAQITPHFLYNTLDAIIWLAEAGRTKEVIQITNALSNFFRISLNNGKEWVTVAEEWEHLQGYLTIQKIRYRDILRYELHMDETLKQQQMLKLLVQPLVENALYHGIKNRRGGGLIRVTAVREGNRLVVTVTDSGAGMNDTRLRQVQDVLDASASTQAEGGYGLYSVDKRIKLYYSQPEGLRVTSSEQEGTTVSFSVPIRG